MNAIIQGTANAETFDITPHRYNAMVEAIRECYQVDEVKDMRDKAKAMEEYLRQAQNQEAERKACEIRIRAERRCGELLRDMEKAKGTKGQLVGRGTIGPSADRAPINEVKTLSELGISYDQSSKFQALADIPEEEFNDILADTQEKPTTAGIVRKIREADESAQTVERINKKTVRFWGILRELERDKYLDKSLSDFNGVMTDGCRADIVRLIPTVHEWLSSMMEELDEFV
jgi:hypothetical protein